MTEVVQQSPVHVHVGDVIEDKYRIEKVLGAGGMGMVVKALHLRLQEPVALKFILPAAATDSSSVRRLLREAQASAKIKSEHVARVYDVGMLNDTTPFLVMEYLVGEDLASLLKRRGPLPVEEAVDYMIQACDALAEAHGLGIVHRDLKPANVFVARGRDRASCVKVLDFGISKIASHSQLVLNEGEALTTSAMLMGSPLYMSPEQLKCSRDVDARTDLWSLGVMLFELLAGRVPFSARSIAELCANVITSAVPSLRSVSDSIPEGVCAVVDACLRKDPSKRLASVAKFASALAPYGSAQSRQIAERIESLGEGLSVANTASAAQPSVDAVSGGGESATGTSFVESSGIVKQRVGSRIWISLAALAILVGGLGVGIGVGFRSTLRVTAPAAGAINDLATSVFEALAASAPTISSSAEGVPASVVVAEPLPSAVVEAGVAVKRGDRPAKAAEGGSPPVSSAAARPTSPGVPTPTETTRRDLTKELLEAPPP